MQCDNCGYIFFQPAKKCTCCSAPYVPTQSSFDVGQENLFTIFEMAPGEGGIPGGVGMAAGATVGVDDYNFTDDFDAGGAEYGVDENVLDLSDAESEGFGVGPVSDPVNPDEFEFDTSDMDDMPTQDNAGSDDFELNLDEDFQDTKASVTDPEPDVGDSMEMDFTGGFDEVEGLGFGDEETQTDNTEEGTAEEISLDTTPEADPEPEISLEPELELAEDEPSLEVSDEPELDIADEQPSLELSEDPSMELPEELSGNPDDLEVVEEEPSMDLPDDLELSEEPELMDPTVEDEFAVEVEDDGGIEFDLDNVDLDEPEEVTYVEEPEKADNENKEEAFMDLEGLEMESPENPDEEDLKQ